MTLNKETFVRTLISYAVLALLAFVGMSTMFTCAGCGVEEVLWTASGMAAMNEVSNDAQNRFLDAVNTLNEETNRINTAVGEIETSINPVATEAYETLKGREKDPVTWIAFASILGNAIMGGRASKKKIGN